MTGVRRLRGRLAALLVVAGALTACSAPRSTFVASPDDDLVLKLPRSWATVRSTASADSTTGQPDGGWVAAFDGAKEPDVKHLDLSTNVRSPVAYAQVSVMTSDQASSTTPDKLRDLLLPFTAATRAQYAADPRAATFRQIGDYDVHGPGGSGVHVIYSYDLGQGREVFDQIALMGSHRTRIYLLLVRCAEACYTTDRAQIAEVMRYFTVKVP